MENEGVIKVLICPTCKKDESFVFCSNPFHLEWGKQNIPSPTEEHYLESMFVRAFYSNGDEEAFKEWMEENEIMGIKIILKNGI